MPSLGYNDVDTIVTRFYSVAPANATIAVPCRVVDATLLGMSR